MTTCRTEFDVIGVLLERKTKVVESPRVWCSGNTRLFQSRFAGSSPVTRSSRIDYSDRKWS
jgi:hypothetical protein